MALAGARCALPCVLVVAVVASATAHGHAKAQGGAVDVVLEMAAHAVVLQREDGSDELVWVRAFNASVPGPTIRVHRGDTVRVTVQNNLETHSADDSHAIGSYHAPNTTNLHFRTVHTSARSFAPSSDGGHVVTSIAPGTAHTYEFRIPPDHAPGTHAYHPLHLGSSALQVGGGACGLFIVEDEEDSVSSALLAMPEQAVVMTELHPRRLRALEQLAGGALGNGTAFGGDKVVLVNGAQVPEIPLQALTWNRLRVLWTSISTPIEWRLDECLLQVRSWHCWQPLYCSATVWVCLQLIAIDGIYLSASRAVESLSMAPGNRVDVAVLCPQGVHSLRDSLGSELASVVATTAGDSPSGETFDGQVGFSPPPYLADLRGTATPLIASDIELRSTTTGCQINGEAFHGARSPTLSARLGTVQMWRLNGASDVSFHLHNTPFQLVDVGEDGLFLEGDWADTLPSGLVETGRSVYVRFQADRFTGDFLFHSVEFDTADQGCAGYATFEGEEGTRGPVGTSGTEEGNDGSSDDNGGAGESNQTILMVVAVACIGTASLVAALWWCRARKRRKRAATSGTALQRAVERPPGGPNPFLAVAATRVTSKSPKLKPLPQQQPSNADAAPGPVPQDKEHSSPRAANPRAAPPPPPPRRSAQGNAHEEGNEEPDVVEEDAEAGQGSESSSFHHDPRLGASTQQFSWESFF